MNVILSILVVAGLLFGGGATVQAAQDDLPNEPLYGLKTWTEDLSLQFRNNQEEKVERLMEMAQNRVQEMKRLTEAGEPIPDQVRQRLEQHIQQALQLCADMDDPSLERALLQLRDRLQEQDRDMEQLQLQTQEQLRTQEQLQLQIQEQLKLQTQTRTMLQERLRLVEEGLQNHEMFRNQVQNGFQYGQDDEVTPPVQDGNGEQNGQPAVVPGGPNTDPGGTNVDPGSGTGEPNPDPGSNSNENGTGEPNPDPGNTSNDNGSGGSGKP